MKIIFWIFLVIFPCMLFANYTVRDIEYKYDKDGNLIRKYSSPDNKEYRLTFSYTYNSLNEMVGFEDVKKHLDYSYTYYPNGKRVAKFIVANGENQSINFLYSFDGGLLNEEYIENNVLKSRSSYFAGLRFVDDIVNHNDNLLEFPLAENHNHPVTISFKQNISNINSFHLTEYGEKQQSILMQKNDNLLEDNEVLNFMQNPKIYGSGYYDSESGLEFVGARYYSPKMQRFISQDSYNLINRYNYANANPVMNYDPDGHMSKIARKVLGGLSNFGINLVVVSLARYPMTLSNSVLIGLPSGLVIGGAMGAASVITQSAIESKKVNTRQLVFQAVFGAIAGSAMGMFPNELVEAGEQAEIDLVSNETEEIVTAGHADSSLAGKKVQNVESLEVKKSVFTYKGPHKDQDITEARNKLITILTSDKNKYWLSCGNGSALKNIPKPIQGLYGINENNFINNMSELSKVKFPALIIQLI